MDNPWLTNEVRRSAPKIVGHLDRIASALEKLVLAKEDRREDGPRCEWCDHRHFPTSTCLVEDCDCTAGGQR